MGAQGKTRFLPGWGELGRPPGARVGGALWAKAGGWWQHPIPSDWVGLRGALPRGPECQAAKQRSLDRSLVELGTQGLCWSMAGARAQAVERWLRTRVEETQLEPRVALSWPPPRPLRPSHRAAGMQSRPLPHPSGEHSQAQRSRVPGSLAQAWTDAGLPGGALVAQEEVGARLPGQECGG